MDRLKQIQEVRMMACLPVCVAGQKAGAGWSGSSVYKEGLGKKVPQYKKGFNSVTTLPDSNSSSRGHQGTQNITILHAR